LSTELQKGSETKAEATQRTAPIKYGRAESVMLSPRQNEKAQQITETKFGKLSGR